MDGDSLPTRQSLLSRLRDLNDSDSWQTFFDRYWKLIYNVARKSGLSDDQAQDVVQETVIVVARKIPEFRYDPSKGSFKQWLLLITRRRIHDHLRRFYRLQSVERKLQDTGLIERGTTSRATPPDAAIDAAWEEEWRETVIQAALARVRQRVNPKQYQVFPLLRRARVACPPSRGNVGPQRGTGLPGETSHQSGGQTRGCPSQSGIRAGERND